MMPIHIFLVVSAVALMGAAMVRVADWFVNPPRVRFQAADGYDQQVSEP